MKIVFIASAGGGVIDKLFGHNLVRENTELLISDRDCGAIQKAVSSGIRAEVFKSVNGAEFSDKLNYRFYTKENCFISFYSRLFTDEFLVPRFGKVFNCHPAILPACKGLDGFGQTMRSNSLFMGCTLHEVNSEMDAGMSVIQAALPIDRGLTIEENRHKVFLMQYYSTLQFIRWWLFGKLSRTSFWSVDDATFNVGVFSPNLDEDFFDFFGIDNEL